MKPLIPLPIGVITFKCGNSCWFAPVRSTHLLAEYLLQPDFHPGALISPKLILNLPFANLTPCNRFPD